MDHEVSKLLQGGNASALIEQLVKDHFKVYLDSPEAKLDKQISDEVMEMMKNESK
tara:strand:+ start:157 stop:321 length:165 start_codon:yes stop_codon:yes gene_type:complete